MDYSLHQAFPSMGFSSTEVACYFLLQEIFLTQGSNPGIEPRSPALQADTLPSELPRKLGTEMLIDFNINLGRSSPWITWKDTGNCFLPLIPMFCVCDLGEGPTVTQAYVVCHKLHPHPPPAASFVDFTCIQLDEGQESKLLRTTNKLTDTEQVFKNRFYYLWNLVQKLSSHIS